MMEHWKERLAHFDEAPVVNFYGVISTSDGWQNLEGTKRPTDENMGVTNFTFDAWRVGGGEVQTTRIHMTAIIDYLDLESLVGSDGELRDHPVAHLTAKVAHKADGSQEALLVAWVGPTEDDAELNKFRPHFTPPLILDCPPFSRLEATYNNSWGGRIFLPSWREFNLESKPGYGRHRSRFSLEIRSVPPSDVRLNYQGIPPSTEQVAAYMYLVENDQHVQDALLRYILDHYAQWQKEYGGDAEYMPEVSEPEQLRSLLILWDMTIYGESRDGYAYVYFQLLPNWDVEHGRGVLLHKDRVVAISYQDSSWDDIIEQDQDTV